MPVFTELILSTINPSKGTFSLEPEFALLDFALGFLKRKEKEYSSKLKLCPKIERKKKSTVFLNLKHEKHNSNLSSNLILFLSVISF